MSLIKKMQMTAARNLATVIEMKFLNQQEFRTWEPLCKRLGLGLKVGIGQSTLTRWLKGEFPLEKAYIVADCLGIDRKIFVDQDFKDFEKLVYDLDLVVNPENKLRQVHKIICLIKGRLEDGTPVLLTYKSPDWKIDLLPNISLPDEEKTDIVAIKTLVAERLDIEPASISCSFNRKDEKMQSRCIKVTGDAEKAELYGKQAYYVNYYCPININGMPSHLRRQEFICKGIKHRWLSLAGMKSDKKNRKFNFDVLVYLSDKFDASLKHLPDSFDDKFIVGK